MKIIGQGGMGAIYLAEDQRLPTTWAIKEMKQEGLTEEALQEAAELFRSEARLLSELRHRNLPRIVDFFQVGAQLYLVMDFIEGETLEARILRDGPLSLSFALEMCLQIADVLDYLHTRTPPVVFRDFKPGNVMLTPQNEVKLIDFGIARTFSKEKNKDTRALGTPGYAAPEQYGRGQSDPRTDLYAFGATVHHALSGRDPTTEPFVFPDLSTFRQDLPGDLVQLLAACLALNPQERPESAYQVKRVLEALLGQTASSMLGRPTTSKLNLDESVPQVQTQAPAPAPVPAAASSPPQTPTPEPDAEAAAPQASSSPPTMTGLPTTGTLGAGVVPVAFAPKAVQIKRLDPGSKAEARFRVKTTETVNLVANSPNMKVEPSRLEPGNHQVVLTLDGKGLAPGSTFTGCVEVEEYEDVELTLEAHVSQPKATIGVLATAYTLCLCTLIPLLNYVTTLILGVVVFSTPKEKRASLKIPWRLSILFTLGYTGLFAAIGFGLAQLDWASYLTQIKGWF